MTKNIQKKLKDTWFYILSNEIWKSPNQQQILSYFLIHLATFLDVWYHGCYCSCVICSSHISLGIYENVFRIRWNLWKSALFYSKWRDSMQAKKLGMTKSMGKNSTNYVTKKCISSKFLQYFSIYFHAMR